MIGFQLCFSLHLRFNKDDGRTKYDDRHSTDRDGGFLVSGAIKVGDKEIKEIDLTKLVLLSKITE